MLTQTYTHHSEVRPTISDDFRFFLCYTDFVKRYDCFFKKLQFQKQSQFYELRGKRYGKEATI